MKTKNLIVVVFGIFFLLSCNDDNNPVPEQEISVELNKTSFSLVVGGREKLLLIVDPVGETVTSANWSSSDTTVATVDDQGVVAALAIGETTITVTVGSSGKEQCLAKIIASPIKNLEMPDAKYPIAKDAVVFIQGEGFTKDSKIILRRNTNLKSASDAGDKLAQIHTQALNYISFYGSVTPGYYSVVLEQDKVQFDLGNINVEIPNIPEYVYDKNKIFWEDTHWRRFQLRGKVKEIKIKKEYSHGSNSLSVFHSTCKFNKNGMLEFENELQDFEGISQPSTRIFSYDVKNRLIKAVHDVGEIQTLEYTYGNHELYYSIYLKTSAEFGLSGYSDNGTICIKGLTQIKFSTTNYSEITQITPGTNSSDVIDTIHYSNGDFVSNYTYTYRDGFPIKASSKHYHFGQYSYAYNHDYSFSATGMPISSTFYSTYGDDATQFFKYVQNCPFYLYSEVSGNIYSGISVYEYDKNWNLSKITVPSENCGPYTVYYQSYDEFGNWTQCKTIDETYSGWTTIRSMTRDITYWE